jgi:hypothetical protein
MTDLARAKAVFDRADAAYMTSRLQAGEERNRLAGERYEAIKALHQTVDDVIRAAYSAGWVSQFIAWGIRK